MKTHIGKKIKEAVKKSGLSVTAFAEKINYSRRNIYVLFKKESIDTDLLMKIGKLLGQNFFEHYSEPEESISSVKESEVLYKTKRNTHHSSVEQLQKENQLLKMKLETEQKEFAQKEIAYLKKITELLEKKRGSH